MNSKNITVLFVLLLIVGAWFLLDYQNRPVSNNDQYYSDRTSSSVKDEDLPNINATSTNSSIKSMHNITIETSKGKIVFETYDTDAPKTVENFITLANKGFYNGVIFHRIIEGFMIQGGDPTGTGTGGPGYKFADELDPNSTLYKQGYVRGTVAMANSGPNTNGSQFFIMHKDTPLPPSYTIFGKVVSGLEVVDDIAGVTVNENDRPIQDVVIKSVAVETKK